MMRKSIEMKVVAVIILLCIQIQFMPSSAQEAPISNSGLPPAPTPLGNEDFCWIRYEDCVNDHINNTGSDPQFDPKSPSFNVTEYLCCPLIQQTARTEKPCFCTVSTFLQENPSQATNVTQLLSICNIVDSLASLDNFCQGEVQSPDAAPMMPPSGDS